MKRANKSVFSWKFSTDEPNKKIFWGLTNPPGGLVRLNSISISRFSDDPQGVMMLILNHDQLDKSRIEANTREKLQPLQDAKLIAEWQGHCMNLATIVEVIVVLPPNQEFHKVALNLYWKFMDGTNIQYIDQRRRLLGILRYEPVPYVRKGKEWVMLQEHWLTAFAAEHSF